MPSFSHDIHRGVPDADTCRHGLPGRCSAGLMTSFTGRGVGNVNAVSRRSTSSWFQLRASRLSIRCLTMLARRRLGVPGFAQLAER